MYRASNSGPFRLWLDRTHLFLGLFLLGYAAAQPPLATDGAYYLGRGDTERPVLVEVLIYEPGTAEVRVSEAPPRAGEPAGLRVEAEGQLTPNGEAGRLVEADGLELEVPTLHEGSLDPFGAGTLRIDGDSPLRLEGIGSFLLGTLELADGSFTLQRQEPFLYAEPWSGVQPTSFPMDDSMREGLEQRLALPQGISGIYSESTSSTVAALDHDLLSVFTLLDTFTGGAHPNTHRATATFLHGQDGWLRVPRACDAAEHLGWGCDQQVLREKIIADLRAQEAAWVTQGEVTERTEWLLDLFVLTPEGVRFIFDPYEVGPYVQGPFEVLIPYAELD